MNERKRQIIKLSFMILLTFIFFLAEIICGHMTGSLALVGDSYHMISDLLALIIGLSCLTISTKSSKQNTFGWARAEILGALVNSVFLAALCFTISIEAIERLVHPAEIKETNILITVGCIGLAVNLLGLLLFYNEAHGHSHASSCGLAKNAELCKQKSNAPLLATSSAAAGQSQTAAVSENDAPNFTNHNNVNCQNVGCETQKQCHPDDDSMKTNFHTVTSRDHIESGRPGCIDSIPKYSAGERQSHKPVHFTISSLSCGDLPLKSLKTGFLCSPSQIEVLTRERFDAERTRTWKNVSFTDLAFPQFDQEEGNTNFHNNSENQMNIRGVFLHIMGDALGSTVVIASALIVKYCEGEWTLRVDPALSLLMVAIILTTTFPLFKRSSLILLQHVPGHIQIAELAERLTSEIEGVLGIHELHIWQLVGSKLIASVHVKCRNAREYETISVKIKEFFHNEGIHSTTVQPEFVEEQEKAVLEKCSLECGPDKSCEMNKCCSNVKKRIKLIRKHNSEIIS